MNKKFNQILWIATMDRSNHTKTQQNTKELQPFMKLKLVYIFYTYFPRYIYIYTQPIVLDNYKWDVPKTKTLLYRLSHKLVVADNCTLASVMFVVSLCFLLAAVFNQSEGDIRCPNGEDIAVSMFSDCQREILNIVELMCSLFAPDSNSNTTGMCSYSSLLHISTLKDGPCINQAVPMIWMAHRKFYPTELFSLNVMFIP